MQRAGVSVLVVALSLSISAVAAGGGKGPKPTPAGGTIRQLEAPPHPDGAFFSNNAWKINDDGVIVGSAYWFLPLGEEDFLEEGVALRWIDGEMEVLDGDVVTVLDDGTEASGPALFAEARGINRHGEIVAHVYTAGGANEGDHAAVWDDDGGVWRTLPLPEGAVFAAGRDINDAGHVAGFSSAGPWLWRGGEAELLPPLFPDGQGCGVFAMNDLDMVTGPCFDAEGIGHAVVWWGGQVWELPSFGGAVSWGRAINDLGQVTGYADVPGRQQGRAVAWSIWRPDEVRILAEQGAGNGINDLGVMVGYTGINGGAGADMPRGRIWAGNRTWELPTANGGLVFPRDINNRGVVVGTAEFVEFEQQPFVWEPPR